MKEKTYPQEELKDILLPILKSKGVLYKKSKKIFAKKAKEGEHIYTITSDGVETENTANKGDYIIKNQTEAGEMYIVGKRKFKERYKYLKKAKNEFSLYSPRGKVIAIEMTSAFLTANDFEEVFYFISPWQEKMIVRKDDFLVCPPDFSEIYRIARKEFFETYQFEEEEEE